MDADQPDPEPVTPDPITERLDPDGLKGAHGRTGRLLKAAGLPFEEDEFEAAAAADADDSSASSEDSADDSSESGSAG